MDSLPSFIKDAPIGAAMFDRDMRYIAYSPRWLLDHQIDSIPLGESHYRIFPELPERWKGVHRRALAGETIRESEDRFERANGSVIWLRWEVRPWRRAGGKIAGIIIFTEDITPQKNAEEALRDALARQRLAQSTAQIGVWDWDIPANRTFLNDEYYALYGLPKGERHSYHSFLALVHPADRAAVDAAMHAALDGKSGINFDYRMVRLNDGKTRWVSSKGEVVFNAAGEPIRAMGAVFDITERKEMERELREVNRRKSEFLAMLAHELRNPLTPIKNALNALARMNGEKNAQTSKKSTLLQMASRQVDHLLHLANDLIDVERIDHGKIKLDKKPTNLADTFERAVELCKPGVVAKRQSLELRPTAETLTIDGDPIRLTQVFANLIDNASKYTGDGGQIEVRAGREGREAVVRVTDNGVGIPPDRLASIFDMFTQYSENGASPGGLGVGLALAHRLVTAHGGDIKAHSDGLGRGSQFVVRLPLAEA